MHITVLTGGSTPERDVALAGAAQVVAALRQREHSVTVVDTVNGPLGSADEQSVLEAPVRRHPPTVEDLIRLAGRERLESLVALPEIRGADVVFLVLHGKQGEGGEIQALFDLAGITYTGSGPLGSALAMDKDIAKRLFEASGVPTPQWQMWPLRPGESMQLKFPIVVKPSKVGSSVGLTVVHSQDDFEAAVELAGRYDNDVMLEQFIDGPEFTVGVLEKQALTVGEIIPQHATFDYECKYTPGMTKEVFPADIPDELSAELRRLALQAHCTLKLRDFSRIDFKVNPGDGPSCLEANTLPGLTGTSLLPQSAAASGIPFDDLCERICQTAFHRASEQTSSDR
jgi:D-alanine-D-alanine ligase